MSNPHYASAGATFTDVALTRFSAFAVAVWQAARMRYRRRVTLQRLSELDDRMLKDIGLGRSEIPSAAEFAAAERERQFYRLRRRR